MTQVPASSHGGGPAAGTYAPVANASGVTVDTTTYDDFVSGSGKLTTLVFPTEQGFFALAKTGDTYPRYVFSSDPTDLGLMLSNGGAGGHFAGISLNSATGQLGLSGAQGNGVAIDSGQHDADAVRFSQVSPRFNITAGALPTVAPVSGTAFQCATARDVFLLVPVTYNPGVATTATCKVEVSPDNVTFSTLITITQPVGTVFDGSIEPVSLDVPAGWWVKLTVTNATLGTGTYY